MLNEVGGLRGLAPLIESHLYIIPERSWGFKGALPHYPLPII